MPWSEEFDSEHEEWWQSIHNMNNPHEIWADDNNEIPGKTEDDREKYYNWNRKWEKDNPMPFEIKYWYSWDNSDSVVFCVPDSIKEECDTVSFLDINKIKVSDEGLQKFKEFCDKYNIEGEPEWLLCAVYG